MLENYVSGNYCRFKLSPCAVRLVVSDRKVRGASSACENFVESLNTSFHLAAENLTKAGLAEVYKITKGKLKKHFVCRVLHSCVAVEKWRLTT